MFKKYAPSGHHSQLSKSDVKELRKLGAEVLGVEEADLDCLLPPKTDVIQTKLSTKALVYSVNDQPLFFDPNGKGGVVPTVYTLWLLPEAMKKGIVTHSEVSPKVLGGADLMLPGFSTEECGWDDLTFDAGDLLALRVRGNPSFFAIGEAVVSKAQATESKMKGRGLKILHHYPDALNWATKQLPAPPFNRNACYNLKGRWLELKGIKALKGNRAMRWTTKHR